VVQPPLAPNVHGVRAPGWVLAGTPLPEQHRAPAGGGRVRAARPASDRAWTEDAGQPVAPWQALVDSGAPVTVPPRQTVEVLWDFEEYRCGYPVLEWTGGAGARVELEWAESLYAVPDGEPLAAHDAKGNRGEVTGKRWLGFGDVWIASGKARQTAPALWWRSGRYVRLRVRTGARPLTLRRLAVLTTRYPLERNWAWRSSATDWDAVLPLLASGLEQCAHETWVDCPYYEQMCYVGDTRLHALSNYAAYGDDRLSRRAIELFDWSRCGSLAGLVAERYPSGWRQESATYALIWIWMVRDYLLWRADAEFVRARLTGVRQLLEVFLALRREDGLLGPVPGWPFVDWVPQWREGCGPGVREGDSSLVNLHLVLALQAAAEIEEALGDQAMAARNRMLADDLMQRVLARYGRAGVLLDAPGASLVSEHAQVLALLTGLLGREREAACMRVLLEERAEARCSIYFSFYLLEVLARHGESAAFFRKLKFWRDLPGASFVSLPEQPEPSRSDCHGWGAHPLFHTLASVAGIRPAAPGFARVRIAPMPGPLEHFTAEMVHPRGRVRIEGRDLQGRGEFVIRLPKGVPGELHWRGEVRAVPPGPPVTL
jgi:alpha-L-rhamnosidase